ncbi:SigE family RNA polymerase sigma factor [Streptacidiphilus sp. EB129]|uniref:SigE family RNA polymerase sigma factor n=1 Tax=Streptacidiphilus sp. EB129 TaxID=3156262 RepID=UPI00351861B6
MKREQQAALDAEFSTFVVNRGRYLHRLAELLTGDPHRASDLVQSALERAYPRWQRIQADDPTAYVRRIIVNGHRSWWHRRLNRELPAEPAPDRAAPGDLAEGHAQRSVVLGALRQLTARERSVIALRFYGDLSESEIAAELEIAPGTVKSTVHRALGKLRAMPELADSSTAHPRLPELDPLMNEVTR